MAVESLSKLRVSDGLLLAGGVCTHYKFKHGGEALPLVQLSKSPCRKVKKPCSSVRRADRAAKSAESHGDHGRLLTKRTTCRTPPPDRPVTRKPPLTCNPSLASINNNRIIYIYICTYSTYIYMYT